jgi:pimeloyl-[acyl-carrier protein] methyl ester esterase
MSTLERDDGVHLHVESTGSGPPLLALHGWSRSSLDLAGLAERLSPRHRVCRPDLRGHGRSTAGRMSLEALGADLEAVAEAEALTGALLVGWSLGAQVALAALASRPGLRRRVAGLVLIGATPRFTSGDGWPHGRPRRAVEGLALLVRRRAEQAMARFLDDCFAEGELDQAGRARVASLATPLPDLGCALAGLDVLMATDLRSALADVDRPTLVIHGGSDAVVPPGAGRALAQAIPGARHVELPGVGHAPFLSREAELAGLVGAFLEGR